MIQLSSLLPIVPQGPVRPALLASGAAGSFALALGALVLPRPDAPVAEGEGDALLPGRQMLAEAGKDLPEPVSEEDSTEAPDVPDSTDIAFAWFAIAPAPEPAPSPPGVATTVVAVAIEPEGRPATEAVAFSDSVAPLDSGADAEIGVPVAVAQEGKAGPAPTIVKPMRAEALSIPADEVLDIAVSKPPAAEAVASPMPSIPSPITVQIAESVRQEKAPECALEAVIQPAGKTSGQVRTVPAQGPAEQTLAMQSRAPVVAAPLPTPFNPAIEAAVAASAPVVPAPLRRASGAESAALAILASATDAAPTHAVSAPVQVQQGALDTSRHEWTGKMVEHIEALRDAVPVRETRLSLAPEALGKVEVSIRHEGDRVHVHFTTETPAARQLIAEAQPRLGELAEARGLKLGQTSFESGTAGQGPNRENRDTPAQQSLKPRPANPGSTVGAADDDRIA